MKIHQNAQSRRRIQAKHMQKPIHTPHQGRTPARQRPKPSQEPTRRRPPFSGGAFNTRGGGCKRCFPKIPSKLTSSSLYKKTPFTFMDHRHTRKQERMRASFLPRLQLELEQGVSELQVGGVPECQLPLLLVLGDPSTSNRRSAGVVSSLYICTSMNQELLGI